MSRPSLVRPPGQGFEAIAWTGEEGGLLLLLDQRRLPSEVVEIPCRHLEQVAEAIRILAVRGAPAIGIAAAYGLAQVALGIARRSRSGGEEPVRGPEARQASLEEAARLLRSTRPTAVNLFWAIDRILACSRGQAGLDPAGWADGLLAEARAIHEQDLAMCRAMGRHGAALVPMGAGVLTHCNAGALATGGYGTALGVIRAAHEAGKGIRVYADETRPLLQGSRLTAWELMQDGIDVTLLCDSMAPFAMARSLIDLVVVGADRIAANGDVANKIGTYGLAVAARRHGIPFYVVAPSSTFDQSLESGEQIPIEERGPEELRYFAGCLLAPEQAATWNPAFDVTPAELVTAIVTERGVAWPPYAASLKEMLGVGAGP